MPKKETKEIKKDKTKIKKETKVKELETVESIAETEIDTTKKVKKGKKEWNKNSEKKFLIIWIITLIIVIWAVFFLNNMKNSTSTIIENQSKKETVNKGDTVKVDYVWKLEDGTIFDSSIEEFAKKMKNYSEWRSYSPLEFTVGAWQMIKWFDEGVVWMKLWEKKTLTIKPIDAYWEKTISQDIPKEYLQDKFTQTVPIENFQDKITKGYPLETLWEKWKDLKEWQSLDLGWATWIVKSLSWWVVTIEIDNTQNPFYWKKLEVWLTSEYQGNWLKITALTDKDATIEIDNKQSPFYGKKLIEWLTWKAPDWQDIKIIAIEETSIKVEVPNTHELAWKTLIFDVEIKEIK
ncbi:MAG: hypothetical protein ACD_4C00223G0001 [uncultured bacterium (gcode 4)]|uniref:peptidylprolyl isomerase n=1 Tax=uncultured bacterium (gcode 4) TaxID=1234023 RepID=K2GTF5_9BACT|nr:MAG: hypothetical protein ACD_4C00223G0001 [uncultured bacterium (gcode 4)]